MFPARNLEAPDGKFSLAYISVTYGIPSNIKRQLKRQKEGILMDPKSPKRILKFPSALYVKARGMKRCMIQYDPTHALEAG